MAAAKKQRTNQDVCFLQESEGNRALALKVGNRIFTPDEVAYIGLSVPHGAEFDSNAITEPGLIVTAAETIDPEE
jgi:hypothetical protein